MSRVGSKVACFQAFKSGADVFGMGTQRLMLELGQDFICMERLGPSLKTLELVFLTRFLFLRNGVNLSVITRKIQI